MPIRFKFMVFGLVWALVIATANTLIARSALEYNWLGHLVLLGLLVLGCSAIGWFFGERLDLLKDKVDHDSLTILLNQPAFFTKANLHFQLGTRHQDNIAIIMIDLDYFKLVNDNNSHLVGSAVLKDVAEIIADNLRETDLAARFGGDEFIICLPRTDLDQATVVANRVRVAIEGYQFQKQKKSQVTVTASCGVASAVCYSSSSILELTELADKQLYRAKKSGRNQVAA